MSPQSAPALQQPSDEKAEDGSKASQQAMSETAEKQLSVDGGLENQQGQVKPVVPVQKRRRVTRACDECRRKKIKVCDI